MTHTGKFLVALLVGIATLILSVTPTTTQAPYGEVREEIPAPSRPRVLADFGKLPLYFIENQGQLDPRVAYYIQGRDKSIYFTPEGVTYVLMGAPDQKGLPEVTSPAGSQAHDHLASFGGTRSASDVRICLPSAGR